MRINLHQNFVPLRLLIAAMLAPSSQAHSQTPNVKNDQVSLGGQPSTQFFLAGTWEMTAAYEILADGTRVTNYSEHPDGLLMVDTRGRYSLQIFRPARAKFASGAKTLGTTEEYRETVLGSSTHTGQLEADPAQGKLVFKIALSSYPNWEATTQVRDYHFKDGVLSYQVPASASGNGTIAYSVWKRVD